MTTFINLYGGPGLGKSTVAAGVFFTLKCMGINCEYINEFAKELVWAKRYEDLKVQPYVTGKQYKKLCHIAGQVDLAVCDSPLLTGLLYPGTGSSPGWVTSVIEQFKTFDNLNFMITRNAIHHPYTEKGRMQTEDESRDIDLKVIELLEKEQIPYMKLKAMPMEKVVEIITNISVAHISGTPIFLYVEQGLISSVGYTPPTTFIEGVEIVKL